MCNNIIYCVVNLNIYNNQNSNKYKTKMALGCLTRDTIARINQHLPNWNLEVYNYGTNSAIAFRSHPKHLKKQDKGSQI